LLMYVGLLEILPAPMMCAIASHSKGRDNIC
jgi:hypothetical protein